MTKVNKIGSLTWRLILAEHSNHAHMHAHTHANTKSMSGPHPKPVEPEPLGSRSAHGGFTKLPRWFWWTARIQTNENSIRTWRMINDSKDYPLEGSPLRSLQALWRCCPGSKWFYLLLGSCFQIIWHIFWNNLNIGNVLSFDSEFEWVWIKILKWF